MSSVSIHVTVSFESVDLGTIMGIDPINTRRKRRRRVWHEVTAECQLGPGGGEASVLFFNDGDKY